jgi:hypothetical protein
VVDNDSVPRADSAGEELKWAVFPVGTDETYHSREMREHLPGWEDGRRTKEWTLLKAGPNIHGLLSSSLLSLPPSSPPYLPAISCFILRIAANERKRRGERRRTQALVRISKSRLVADALVSESLLESLRV